MSPQPGWPEIILRIIFTLAAGAIIGVNRQERGHSAGLRTTMLVCLAASLSMIQVNLLLGMNGKSPSSFIVMDLMRLPLGILSGIGFIGAGAILRKDTMVTGVTTAATIWFTTVMGLCIGGGQIALGMIALIVGVGILWGLKALEVRWHKPAQGTLTLSIEGRDFSQEEIVRKISAGGGRIAHWLEFAIDDGGAGGKQTCRVILDDSKNEAEPPLFLASLSQTPGIGRVEWKANR